PRYLRVMQLQKELRTGGNLLHSARLHDARVHAWRIADEQVKPRRFLFEIERLTVAAVRQAAAIIISRDARLHAHQEAFAHEDRVLLALGAVLLHLCFRKVATALTGFVGLL